VTLDAGQPAALGPAPVAIHDDGDVPREAVVSQRVIRHVCSSLGFASLRAPLRGACG
jgi:hypothetical protein